jgi:DNA-3-methyladenine glycosylase II
MNTAYGPPYAELTRREPRFARLVGTYGHPDPFVWHDGGRTGSSMYAAMVLHVVSQGISAVTAFHTYDRITEDTGGGILTPQGVERLGYDALRGYGLLPAKVTCLLDLSARQAGGAIDLENMADLDDSEVISALTAVRGIGQWSAQAFLMRQLHRPDVLPVTDKGIQVAVQRLWQLTRPPTMSEVRKMAMPWSPYRSYAAALLWRSQRPVGEPSDQKERALIKLAADRARRHPHRP